MAGQTAHLRHECGTCARIASRIHFRFIASLKLPFKFYPEDRAARTTSFEQRSLPAGAGARRRDIKGGVMTSVEMASGGAEPATAEDCFGLGMVYSAGAGVAVDLVQAHKWFNIAAMRGHARPQAGSGAAPRGCRADERFRDRLRATFCARLAQGSSRGAGSICAHTRGGLMR